MGRYKLLIIAIKTDIVYVGPAVEFATSGFRLSWFSLTNNEVCNLVSPKLPMFYSKLEMVPS